MAVEEVIISYKADIQGLKPVAREMDNIAAATKEVGNEVKAAFSGQVLNEANAGLQKHVVEIQKVETAYSNAKQELKALENQIISGGLEGEALTKATQRAAELKDNIGDVRDEIKRLSSDTRVFDLVAEGARGIAGAMSLAAGASALFGKENEDLQKAIMKAQGALALLQGAQELATIATTKGGIASKAYAAALQVVDKIQKMFAISSAAAWGAVTAGVGLAVAALAYFITKADDAKVSTEELSKVQEIYANQSANRFSAAVQKDANALNRQIIASKTSIAQINLQIQAEQKLQEGFKNRISAIEPAIEDLKRDGLQADANFDALNKNLQEQDKLLVESEQRLKNLYTALGQAQQKFIDEDIAKTRKARQLRLEGEAQFAKAAAETFKRSIDEGGIIFDEPLITEKSVSQTTDNAEDLAIAFRTVESASLSADQKVKKFAETFSVFAEELKKVGEVINNVASIYMAELENESRVLAQEKENQLAIERDFTTQQLLNAGGDAKQKELILKESEMRKQKIERDAAIKSAMLERDKAVLNKTMGITNAIINTAVGVASALKDGLAGIGTAALIAALGAIQIASIAAQPLPEIPKFEKGGAVPLMGGNIRKDGAIIGRSHRKKGVLIEAEGGEFINNKESAAKYYDELKAANEGNLEGLIFDKYIAPAMRKIEQVKAQEIYDDYMVRVELKRNRESEQMNAQYIVKGVSDAVSENAYYQQRYFR